MRRPSSTPLVTNKLSAGTMKERPVEHPRGWRPRAPKNPINQGEAQTLSALGRTLYGDRSDPTGHLLTEGRQRQRFHQHMEHRTVMSFLPLKLGLTAFLSFNVCCCSYNHASLNTFGPGRSRAPWGCDTTSLFYYLMVKNFYPNERVIRSFNYLT